MDKLMNTDPCLVTIFSRVMFKEPVDAIIMSSFLDLDTRVTSYSNRMSLCYYDTSEAWARDV